MEFKISKYETLVITVMKRHRVTRKRNKKRLKHAENVFRENLHLKDVC